jgi:hypothetical protein
VSVGPEDFGILLCSSSRTRSVTSSSPTTLNVGNRSPTVTILTGQSSQAREVSLGAEIERQTNLFTDDHRSRSSYFSMIRSGVEIESDHSLSNTVPREANQVETGTVANTRLFCLVHSRMNSESRRDVGPKFLDR